jgi:RNA polymerase sigma-70 factor (ECF subfamily)
LRYILHQFGLQAFKFSIPLLVDGYSQATELSLRYVSPCSALTSGNRHEITRPSMRDFTSHFNSSVSSQVRPGNSHATRKIESETVRILLRPRGVAMTSIDQDVLIKNANEFAPRREDPLVTAVKVGVPEAFAQLHAIYSSRLYRTIAAITKNPEDAHDALQETFLRAHLAVHAFESRSGIYSWLSRIAINSAFMILRKRRAHPEVLFDPQPDDRCETIYFEPKDPAPNPEEAYSLRQHQVKTLSAIRRLGPKLRWPLQMQMKHGWSVREISKALNISEAAVKSRLSRARRQLSTTLADQKRVATHHRQSVSASAGRDSVLP